LHRKRDWRDAARAWKYQHELGVEGEQFNMRGVKKKKIHWTKGGYDGRYGEEGG